MTEPVNLRWVGDRLVSRCAGILSLEEEARFDELTSTDDGCRALWEQFLETSPANVADPEHLSPYKLARWNRMRTTLRGVERRLVRRHLQGCERCRSELVRLGFGPVLDSIPELETDVILADARRTAARPESAGTVRRSRGPFASRWIVGWAVTVTVVLGFVLLRIAPRAEPALHSVPVASVGLVTRGTDDAVVRVEMSKDRRTAALGVRRPPGLDGDESVRALIEGPNDFSVASEWMPAGQLTLPRVLIVSSPDPIPTGAHVLRIERPAPGPAITIPFEVTPEANGNAGGSAR